MASVNSRCLRRKTGSFLSSCLMNLRRCSYFLLALMLSLTFGLTSCEGTKVCEGLNNGLGTANSSKKVRKGNRGGYKSPRELEARDRSKKRNRNRSRNSMRKSRGGGNTTGKGKAHFGGGINISGTFHIGGGGSDDAKH